MVGWKVSEAQRLRSLEAENAKLKRLWRTPCWTYRRSRRCWEKTSDAQIQEGGHGLGGEGEREGIRSAGRLVVRKRGGRKRPLGTRVPMTIPQGANQRRSVDFASDTLMDSRRFRVLCVIDDLTRECLAGYHREQLHHRGAGFERTGPYRRTAWRAVTDGVRQRHRVHVQCDARMATGPRSRLALHRSRQAHTERVGGEFHRPAA